MAIKVQSRRLWNLGSISDLQDNVTERFPPPKMKAAGRVSLSVAVGVITAGMFFVGDIQMTTSTLVAPSATTIAQGARLSPPLESLFAENRHGFSMEDEARLLSQLEGVPFSRWSPSADQVSEAIGQNLEEKIENRSIAEVNELLKRGKRA
jgi:hypothetical protein